LELLQITPNRVQNAIINGINNPSYRFITACVSRRVGKTFIANIILQCVALMPGMSVLIISPDYSLSSISWDLQRELLDKFDIERIRDNAKDRIIELTNGSLIKIASVSRVDSAVGRSYDLIIFDEAALNDAGGQAFNVALRPTLDKDSAKCLFISTPRGDNWFREFFERGFSKDPSLSQWLSIHADYKENPRASVSDIAEARKTMSHAEFEQEYLANFVTFEGQVWSLSNDCIVDLTREINAICAAPSKVEVIAGLDIGFRDQTALVVLAVQQFEDFNKYFLIDEYVATERATSRHAEEIAERVRLYDLDWIFCDAGAAQTRFDLAATYDITTIAAIKSVIDGIGAVGAVIDHNRLIVHEECIESIYALRNYKWKGKVEAGAWNIETEKPEHNRASHCADAIRYAIYTYEQSMGGIT
jgi:phage terminase large subunit